ncbi:MAG: hypothetical protein MUC36_12980 [Planctomycetes bacterium]|jgi:hypothetical protein|nr:hypothetical protein [Planctomycetota bacterium]
MQLHYVPTLMCLGLLTAQQVPEAIEPNQSTTTATVLACGAEALGSLGSAVDVDWYQITLSGVRDLRLETGPGNGAEIGDTVLVLLDFTGAPLQTNDDGLARGRHASLFASSLPAGTYYCSVERGPLAAASGSYTLDVRCSLPVVLPAAPIAAEGPENNDPRSSGVPTTVTLPARCNGLIPTTGPSGDWDFWRFVLPVDSFVRARVQATASHPSPPVLDDPILYLYDNAAPPALLAGPFYASNFGVFDTAIDLRLPAGSYQVAIRGWAGSIAGRYYLDLARTDAGRVTVHAGGCGGRVLDVATTLVGPGAPLRTERATLGGTYALRGSSLGSGGFVFHMVGFQAQSIDLGALGAPGCTAEVVFVDAVLQVADTGGSTTYVIAVPETPSLAGTVLESQLAVLDFANPLGLSFSNRVTGALGD